MDVLSVWPLDPRALRGMEKFRNGSQSGYERGLELRGRGLEWIEWAKSIKTRVSYLDPDFCWEPLNLGYHHPSCFFSGSGRPR